MIKKTFTLTVNNIRQLEDAAKEIGIPGSELLRRIIEDYFKDRKANGHG